MTGVTADSAVPTVPVTLGVDWVVARAGAETVNVALAVVPVSVVGPLAETAPVVSG